MDCVVRATPASIGVFTPDAKAGVTTRVSLQAIVQTMTVALISRPLSIGNCSLSAVPADNTLFEREVSHV